MLYKFYSKKTNLNDETNCATMLTQVTANNSKNILSLLYIKEYVINI